jgi:hypothetical protein
VNVGNLFTELKRRSVYKVAAAYLVVAWLAIQVATQTFPFFDDPNWVVRAVIVPLCLGFPVALVLAWAFDLTPEGVRRRNERSRDWSVCSRRHTARTPSLKLNCVPIRSGIRCARTCASRRS